MNAKQARELSKINNKQSNDWLQEVIKKIKTATEEGKYSITVYVGSGSQTNKRFSEQLELKKKSLRSLGYEVTSRYTTSWSTIFYSEFEYYLCVKW